MMTPDTTIVRARAGDADALGVLYRAHHPAILRYLRGMGMADAEDVGSQVWIDVARSLDRFTGDDGDLRRWLFTIARRRMIDAHRFRSRHPEVPMAEPARGTADRSPGATPRAGGATPMHAGADSAADAAAEAEAALDRATELLAQLPPAQAEVVMLRVVLGFSVDEVAVLVDRRPAAVRVLAHRGLTRLRARLTPDDAVAAPGADVGDVGDLGDLGDLGDQDGEPAGDGSGVGRTAPSGGDGPARETPDGPPAMKGTR